MTTLDDRPIIKTRVDGTVGWVTVDRVEERSDLQTVQRQTLEAFVEHARNPAVQTIALSDFHRIVLNSAAASHGVTADPLLAEELALLCREVTELLSTSSKTLVVRCGSKHVTLGSAGSPAHIEPLTGRERQVLGMAAEGMSAREIAAALFISERTVETHVSNGYRKLGINSRIDLIRRAAEFGF